MRLAVDFDRTLWALPSGAVRLGPSGLLRFMGSHAAGGVPSQPGADAALAALQPTLLVVLTHRPATLAGPTVGWLRRWLTVQPDLLVHTRRGPWDRPAHKPAVAAALQLDLLIDDEPGNLVGCSRRGVDGLLFAAAAPWWSPYPATDRWSDIPQIVAGRTVGRPRRTLRPPQGRLAGRICSVPLR